MKCPIESAAEICQGYLARQFDQLSARKVPLQFGKQLVADFRRRPRHGNGKVKNEFLDRTKYVAFFIIGEMLQFLFADAGCPAVRRA